MNKIFILLFTFNFILIGCKKTSIEDTTTEIIDTKTITHLKIWYTENNYPIFSAKGQIAKSNYGNPN